MIWEYRIEHVTPFILGESFLNDLGRGGWELIYYKSAESFGEKDKYMFKRPKLDKEDTKEL